MPEFDLDGFYDGIDTVDDGMHQRSEYDEGFQPFDPDTSDMDKFLKAYISAALWSSTDKSTPEGGDFLDENYGPADLAPATLEQMTADCNQFRAENAHDIEGQEKRAGHDFWLTKNHHGAGFWDGDWPEAGDRLTEACKKYPEVSLYIGDDGLIHS
jgi:hypothetical protein